MLREVKSCGPKLTLDDISEHERIVGICIPDEYKSFLLKYNGGIPSPRVFPVRGLQGDSHGLICLFLGVGHQVETSNLGWDSREIGDIPCDLLPIGRSDGGDLICMSTADQDYGAVYYWDIYNEQAANGRENAYWIVNSFSEFLEVLQDPAAG